MDAETIGERLNNPLNIRLTDNHWLGKLTPSSDKSFEQFDKPENGIRAAAKILLTYYYHGIDTISGIIERWAPTNENPTDAYIHNVCDWTGIDPDAHLMLTSMDDLKPVITAMIKQEQGRCAYADSVIETGIKMALAKPAGGVVTE